MTVRKSALLAGTLSLFISQAALAVGLGSIKLHSALNEPLSAEIEILNPGSLADTQILVDLANAELFKKAGVDRPFFLSTLEFNVGKNESGKSMIYVTSNKAVKEPYLNFLIELYWPSGRMLREYTVLLDLPVFSPEKSPNKVIKKVATPAQKTLQKKIRQQSVSTRPSKPVIAGDESYEVKSGDTLWEIASRSRPEGATITQTMAAIEQLNPSAFINGDINLLKRGKILRLPVDSRIANAPPQPAASVQSEKNEVAGSELIGNITAEPVVPVKDESEGRLTLSVDKPVQAAENSSVLEGRADATEIADGAAEVLQNELAIISDEMARNERDLADKDQRIAQLEEQLSTMQRMLEIQNNDLASIQENMANNIAQSESGQEPVADAEPVTAPDMETAPPAASTQKPAASTGQSSSSWIDYIYHIIAGIILLFVLLGSFTRRQEDSDSDSSIDPRNTQTPPVGDKLPLNKGPLNKAALGAAEEKPLQAQEPHFDISQPKHTLAAATMSDLDDVELDTDDNMFLLDDDVSQQDEVNLDDVFGETDVDETPAEDDVDVAAAGDTDELDVDMDSALLGGDTGPNDELNVQSSRSADDSAELAQVDDGDLDIGGDLSDLHDFSPSLQSPGEFSEDTVSDDELDGLLGGDDISTKLDLARAFIDMGDKEGAEDILNEILDAGDDEQKSAAKVLFRKL